MLNLGADDVSARHVARKSASRTSRERYVTLGFTDCKMTEGKSREPA